MSRPGSESTSRILREHDFRWQGVALRRYKEGPEESFSRVSRQSLAGRGDGAAGHELRYFEVDPGGYSSLERHEHTHVVVVIRGSGYVVLDGEVEPVSPFDCVYVAPGCQHQFRAAGTDALGFLCVVEGHRDRPVAATAEEVATVAAHPKLKSDRA